MPLLTREEILERDDVVYEDVPTPEWGAGAEVRIRGLSAYDRDRFEASVIQGTGAQRRVDTCNLRARLVSWCAVDGEGERLFTRSDVKALGEKSGRVVDRLFKAAQRLSGLTDDDVDELAKNSGSAQAEDSLSDSA